MFDVKSITWGFKLLRDKRSLSLSYCNVFQMPDVFAFSVLSFGSIGERYFVI